MDRDGAIAEVDAWLIEMTPRPDRPIRVHQIRVELINRIAIETMAQLGGLGVDVGRFTDRSYHRTREIGDAANFLGFDGMLVPSARWPCMNLVMFLGNHDARQKLEVTESVVMDWANWPPHPAP